MRISSFPEGHVFTLNSLRAWTQAELLRLFQVQMETVGRRCTDIFAKAGWAFVTIESGAG